jgi:hypothetical protein
MAMTAVTPTTTIGQKRPLEIKVEVEAAAFSSVLAAGHDDDGEEILVEADPLPHEIATDPSLRCRYPSKHCLRTRTVKKTGALHSMCAFHRAKANRNQRRLEKRKRLRHHSSGDLAADLAATVRPPLLVKQEVAPAEGSTATTRLVPGFEPSFKRLLMLEEPATRTTVPQFQSPREVAAEFEPFRTPAALFPEDLEELCELVDVNVRHACAADAIEDYRLLSQLLL